MDMAGNTSLSPYKYFLKALNWILSYTAIILIEFLKLYFYAVWEKSLN